VRAMGVIITAAVTLLMKLASMAVIKNRIISDLGSTWAITVDKPLLLMAYPRTKKDAMNTSTDQSTY
jgi:hypothetical protein